MRHGKLTPSCLNTLMKELKPVSGVVSLKTSHNLPLNMIFSQIVTTIIKVVKVKEDQKNALEEVSEYLEILEKELKNKYFGGESIGMVDLAGNIIALWIPILEELMGVEILTEAKFPKLCKWSHDFGTHPVVKEVSPSKEELVAIFKPRWSPIN
ncbi:hypothetical protein CsatB_000614 [Cannabis sativa]